MNWQNDNVFFVNRNCSVLMTCSFYLCQKRYAKDISLYQNDSHVDVETTRLAMKFRKQF